MTCKSRSQPTTARPSCNRTTAIRDLPVWPLVADPGQSAPTLIVRRTEYSAPRTWHFILGTGFDVAARRVVLGSIHWPQERHLRAARSAHRPERFVLSTNREDLGHGTECWE